LWPWSPRAGRERRRRATTDYSLTLAHFSNANRKKKKNNDNNNNIINP
jgi:hypothetical protein